MEIKDEVIYAKILEVLKKDGSEFYSITQFGGHKDTTLKEIVELLGGDSRKPTEGRIKFREWF